MSTVNRMLEFGGQFKLPTLQLTVSNPRPC
jgi:hypothetical protein